MKAIDRILLVLGAAYTLLFLLSLLFILPRYLSGNLSAFLLAIVFDTEPEGRFLKSFYASLVWTTLPLTSMGLCLISYLIYNRSNGIHGSGQKLAWFGFCASFAASFIPAILVVRQLLTYSVVGVSYPTFIQVLTSFAYLVKSVVNPSLLLGRGGIWIIPLVIFAETGLFFGFFLPGDSLLLTIGVLAAVGRVNLSLILAASIVGAILGDQVGYATGGIAGRGLGSKYRFVSQNINRATEFYSKHGSIAIVLARFVPVIRTFAPIVAGAARMKYSKFVVFNIVGGMLWVVSLMSSGYLIGSHAPIVVDYLNPLIITVIITSPLVWMLSWVWTRRKRALQACSGVLSK